MVVQSKLNEGCLRKEVYLHDHFCPPPVAQNIPAADEPLNQFPKISLPYLIDAIFATQPESALLKNIRGGEGHSNNWSALKIFPESPLHYS